MPCGTLDRVTDVRTTTALRVIASLVVLGVAAGLVLLWPGTLSSTCSGGQLSAPVADRIVKYIANRPAKNISSEESHTMVPTETMFGLVRVPCPWAFSATEAVATRHILAGPPLGFHAGVTGASRPRETPVRRHLG